MNRIQAKMSEIDRTFNVRFNSNSNFKVKLEKTSSAMPVQFDKINLLLKPQIQK